MVIIKNKKGIAGITFLVIALLVVGLGLVVTTNKLYNYYNTHAVSETDDSTFYNIGNSIGSNDNSPQEDNSQTSFSSGGSSGKHSSNSNSEPLPAESKKERLLKKVYEEDYDDFEEIEIDDKTIFYQQREVEGATVEKDFKAYQFDTESEDLVDTNINWRDDLGEYESPQITQAEAEAMVEGEVQFSKLYIISPDSDIFPIEPTPENPCWAVTSINNGNVIVTVIDSVTGEKVGNGIPPPYNAFTLSGPQIFNPCSGDWDFLNNDAEYWFNEMHYNVENVNWPTEDKVQSHIQSNETVLFYEVAHGSSNSFASGCMSGTSSEKTYASEVEEWIEGYNKKAFTFLGSCDAMCETDSGTLSYEFRKGSNEDTVTVGYCGMSGSDCFPYSLQWQQHFFDYLNSRYTIKDAFDQANQDYPVCEDVMRFEGDEDLKLVSCDVNYGEPYCRDNSVYKNKTCHNLAGVSFMKPYSEIPIGDPCGESYCEDWSENYCENGNVIHNRTCHDAGCGEGACYDDESEQEEIIEECEYSCGSAQCLYPDLVIEDLIVQNKIGQNVIFAFTIKNIGDYIANDIYYKVYTNSSDADLEIKIGTSLAPGESTRAYTDPIVYSESGTYNPKIIVDFDNLINESNESNNELSIEVSV
ncbi:MAG: CARDB domain-containing protein [Candidatus Thorarchaeota archaeon]